MLYLIFLSLFLSFTFNLIAERFNLTNSFCKTFCRLLFTFILHKIFQFFAGPKKTLHIKQEWQWESLTGLDKSHFIKQNLSTFRKRERDRMLTETLNILTGFRYGLCHIESDLRLSWRKNKTEMLMLLLMMLLLMLIVLLLLLTLSL